MKHVVDAAEVQAREYQLREHHDRVNGDHTTHGGARLTTPQVRARGRT
jgi:hypothetical protein